MTRAMFDSITPADIPSSATLIAGYADGLYSNIPQMRARFPHATVVSIAVHWTTRAMVLDVENGDATPAEAVGWCTLTMADVPNTDLTIYCGEYAWPSVRAAFQAAHVTEPQYWVASYDGDPTIPGGAVAKQWLSNARYDQSSVADYWPGVDPAPTPSPVPTPAPSPSNPQQEDDMPQWINGSITPGADAQTVLVPAGGAWTAYPHRTLHLSMDKLGAPTASATVRVAAHTGGTSWAWEKPVTVTAAGRPVDVDITGVVKLSLQTADTGVGYAIEAW